MNTLAGTGGLIRLILRRDRVALPIWIVLLALLPVSFATSYARLYPTPADIQTFADSISSTPAELILLGPVLSATLGGLVAWRWITAAGILVGAASLLTVIRHTRVEEEAGRRELLGGTAVGRLAPLTAALSVTIAADLLMALLSGLLMTAVGLPARGAFTLALLVAATGWLFAAAAGLFAQLTRSAGAARGLAFAFLGFTFLVRVLGDAAGQPWLTWLTPLGWMRFARPFAGERPAVFLLFAAAAAALTALAYRLCARRDLDAGLLPTRLGPAGAAPGLNSPLSLAWRLERGTLLAWTAGFAVIGAVFGLVAKTAADQMLSDPAAAEYFRKLGGPSTPADGFFTLALMILIEVIAVSGLLTVLRLRSEETNLRAEPLLAAPVSRLRWAASHLLFAFLGPTAVLAAFGLFAGLTYGLSSEHAARQLPRVLAASLAYLPAVWVLVGFSVLLFGLLPRRAAALTWAVLAAVVLIDLGGEFQRLNPAMLALSPFTHVPKILAGQTAALPLLWLAALAALLTGAGLAALNRRDVE